MVTLRNLLRRGNRETPDPFNPLMNNSIEEQKTILDQLKEEMSESWGIPMNQLFGRNVDTLHDGDPPLDLDENMVEEAQDYLDTFNNMVERLREAGHPPVAVLRENGSPDVPHLEMTSVQEILRGMPFLTTALAPLTEALGELVQPLTEVMTATMEPLRETINALTNLSPEERESFRNHIRNELVVESPTDRYTSGADEVIEMDGGAGQNNNMEARGDFIHTFIRAKLALRERGYEGEIQIISNHRVRETAENSDHTYNLDPNRPDLGLEGSYNPINEKGRIIHRSDCYSWLTDDTLPDVLLFRNVSNGQPIGVVKTGILTLSSVLPCRDGVIQSGPRRGERVDGIGIDRGNVLDGSIVRSGPFEYPSGIQGEPAEPQYFYARWAEGGIGSAEMARRIEGIESNVSIGFDRDLESQRESPLPTNTLEFRDCWFCGSKMNFKECCDATPEMIEGDVKKIWKHKNVEIACCNCTNVLRYIIPRIEHMSEIVIQKKMVQKYLIKEDRLLNSGNNIYSIQIKFDNGTSTLNFTERQFRALLDKHLIDVPIELEGDTLE